MKTYHLSWDIVLGGYPPVHHQEFSDKPCPPKGVKGIKNFKAREVLENDDHEGNENDS